MIEAQPSLSAAEQAFDRRRRSLGLFLGPLALVALLLLPPPGVTPEAARLVAVLAWVIVWWLTEAVPIPITALLGPVVAIIAGVGPATEMLAPFGDPIIFLFLGSFVLAAAMSETGLDKRFAHAILSRPVVAASPARLLSAFALVTAFLSMWLSNSAVTAMMYPIAVSTLAAMGAAASRRFATVLMLMTAYASTVGGIATPVGTPPNLVALGQLETLANMRVEFFSWMALCVPVMLLLLAVLIVFMRWSSGGARGARLAVVLAATPAGGLTRVQGNVLLAFGLTVAGWVLPGIVALAGTGSPLAKLLSRRLDEGAVALLGAGLLFVLPVDWRARRFTATWRTVTGIDWGTLLLFGGGLSLGGAMFRTGLATALGSGLVELTGAQSEIALTYLFAALAVVISEGTSNTAAATMLCPLAVAAAQAAGVSPLIPTVATALGASMSFLMPISTPPNAIVYGSGHVPLTAMLRHGIVLDLVSILLVPTGLLVLRHVVGL